jgi:hypothetical protein
MNLLKVIYTHRNGVLLLILFILFSSFKIFGQSLIVNEFTTIPANVLDPIPRHILVLSTVDPTLHRYSSSKEKLYIELIDSVMIEISHRLSNQGQIPCEVIFGTTLADSSGNIVYTLMKQYKASHAIVISYFDVHFNQTDVVVTEGTAGREKEAYYDIECLIKYQLHNEQVMAFEMPVNRSRFHSSRSVLSGLLAKGPDLVKNRDDAMAISHENVDQYINYFFPLSITRTRQLYDTKEFSKVKEAIAKKDYDLALDESRRFTHHDKPKVAAKANYNCAILMEHKGQAAEAKLYLQESLGFFSLPLANSLKDDYGILY